MKIRHVVFVVMAVMLVFASCASASAPASASKFDASQFPRWVGEEGIWRSVVGRSFRSEARFAPTDAQINDIMSLVIKTPTSGGSNDFFFLVLKDVAQQRDVVGENNASAGTVTIMVFTDRVLENHPRGTPFSPDRGYISAGTACGYINLAAIAHGFGTHMYLTPSGYYDNRPYIPTYHSSGTKPIIEDVYLKDKGYRYFIDGDYRGNPTGNANGAYFDTYGNLKFVLSIVIGTLDETADSQVTTKSYPSNWAYAR